MKPIKAATLVLPAALAVAVAVGVSCGEDEEDEELVACVDVGDTGECEPCRSEDGDKSCAGAPDCYWLEEEGMCDQIQA